MVNKALANKPIERPGMNRRGDCDLARAEQLLDIGWPDAPHRVIRNHAVENWEVAGR